MIMLSMVSYDVEQVYPNYAAASESFVLLVRWDMPCPSPSVRLYGRADKKCDKQRNRIVRVSVSLDFDC